ncbi:hypothetical protein CB0940_09621 [Cercospora beticola]|uniref:BTB domain-containing protein n=1 Tax=Cercospora beticola TaxID=122368 RepID=A0A2G5HI27_CERBT|nr:hypothetical protein CB0940_09621 [Cercospora beticola]PIA92217.1 hypothetical protein CB0940_09621 [Cercospora beticola]WPB06042.1 hypothetical protein RHO25_010698 [Cercospora beticola]
MSNSYFGQPRTGGLFDSSSTSTTPASGSGGFGSTAPAASSKLFGHANTGTSSSSRGLFGSANTGTSASSPGLFGPSNTGPSTSSRGLFGSTNPSTSGPANTGTSTSSRSSFFGSTSPSVTPPISSSGTPATSSANANNQSAKPLSREPEDLKPYRIAEPFDPSSPVITVKVGTSATGTATFHVHQEILRRTSDFLRAKSKEVWSEPGRAVEIPNHSPAIFRLYVNWAYSGLIHLAKKPEESADRSEAQSDSKRPTVEEVIDESQTETESNSVKDSEFTEKSPEKCQAKPQSVMQDDDNAWIILAKAYVLGEELIDAKFKNDILATMRFKQWSVDNETIKPLMGRLSNIIYSGTTGGSDARKFLVDLYYARVTKAELMHKKGSLIQDFAFDVLIAKIP